MIKGRPFRAALFVRLDGSGDLSLPERLFTSEEPTQNFTTLDVGIADGVAGAGVCCCFKHEFNLSGLFHFLPSRWFVLNILTNETFQRFS